MPETVTALPSSSCRRPRLPEVPLPLLLAGLFLVAAVGSGFLYGLFGGDAHDTPHLLQRLRPPSFGLGDGAFVLGSDQLGRDLALRCLKGIEISVGIALAGVAGGCLIGTSVGLLSGYFGGWVDRLLMMLVDVQLALPNLLIILTGIALFGTNTVVLVAMISLARWEGYARLARSMVLKLRRQEFVEAARSVGASPGRILLVHILPNIASPLVVMVTLGLPSVMLLEASLSFIGIGVQPPTPSLGRMVADGRDFLGTHPWVALAPAALIGLVTLSAQTLAEGLRRRFDPRRTA